MAAETSSVRANAPESSSRRGAMAIITALFFIWGFLTSLNDILVPHLKAIFDLQYVEVMLIQFSFFSAYFVFALPSANLIERVGYKRAMVLGLMTMGAGALLFVLAASVPSFPLFLTALIVLAAGITALQVSANPYVAVLGPALSASSRLTLTQAFNSLGTTIGPFLGSLLILSGAPKTIAEIRQLAPADLQAYRLQEAASVKLPYLGVAFAILILCVLIAKSNLPALVVERCDAEVRASVWTQRNLVLGAIAIFVYVGAEVSIGSFLVNYLNQPNIGDLPEELAARYVSLYWGGAMVGRFVGSALLQRVPTGKLLGAFATVASALVFVSMLTSGHVAMWTILLVGLFNSIMFPSIFTLAIDGLGPLTGKGSGILICSIVGGAVIPILQGALADNFGIHRAFILPALCYVYIIYFALRGSRRHTVSGYLQ
ncbi:MAG TPA: sugar MFS transporter [Methylocella sp.]|jgi:FHS family L-fucose permease-like MFS transporter